MSSSPPNATDDTDEGTFVTTLQHMEHPLLSTVRYGPTWDFWRQTREPSTHTFRFCDHGGEFSTIIIGEVCTLSEGTMISALGDHYPGSRRLGTIPITDFTPVRDQIALKCPSIDIGSILFPRLDRVWTRQLAVLESIVKTDKAVDGCNGQSFKVIPPYTCPLNDSTSQRLLTETTLKYQTSPRSPLPNGTGYLRPQPPYSVGNLYNPRCLPDYDAHGPIFREHNRFVVQQAIYTQRGSLVPPWENASALRPGTIIAAVVRPIASIYSGPSGTPVKHYRLTIREIRILRSSSEAAHTLIKHVGFRSKSSVLSGPRRSARLLAKNKVEYYRSG